MKHSLKLLFLFTFFFSFLLGCKAEEKAEVKELTLAPSFELKDTQQNKISLNNYKGKKGVILFFWTTWCPFCRNELSALNDASKELVKDSLILLAINVGEPEYKVNNFIKSRKLNLMILLDRDGEVADSYGLLGVPSYFLINKQGRVVFTSNHYPKEKIKELLLK
ncbi:MAG: peroxiredoxin family protein [Candidatus Omnitrophica bacterium]|nr:peroxiredoxin family protein [Candidatus Omnitrophota bacterium]